jgi:hypothetical protein
MTSLERLARDKHSNLLPKIVNYGCKKFYKIGPWSYHTVLWADIDGDGLKDAVTAR